MALASAPSTTSTCTTILRNDRHLHYD
ncbi:hypothetical protein VTH06DRAFT_617 [Thermothelomyces fergusii]